MIIRSKAHIQPVRLIETLSRDSVLHAHISASLLFKHTLYQLLSKIQLLFTSCSFYIFLTLVYLNLLPSPVDCTITLAVLL